MQAYIHPIAPFDATLGTTISFTWNGNQIYKSKLVVKNNETLTTVYEETIDTMKATYTLPPNSGLINGTYYIAYITVFDVNGDESEIQQIGTPFYCFVTPEFSLSIADDETIYTSSYNVSLTYSQANGEELNYCNITLYSYQKTPLQSSGNIYTSDTNFIITGMENMKQYYIRAIGETVHGIILDTGYILFTVKYEQYKVFTSLELYNDPLTGGIGIKTNIISTEGKANKEVTYIDGKYADLTNNSVNFNIGYEVIGDFTHVFVLYNPVRNKVFASFQNEEKTMSLDLIYREGDYADSNGRKSFIELQAHSACDTSICLGNYMDIPDNTQQIVINLHRINNLFSVESGLVLK